MAVGATTIMTAQTQARMTDAAQVTAMLEWREPRVPGSCNACCTPRTSAAVRSATLTINEAVAQSTGAQRSRVEAVWSTRSRGTAVDGASALTGQRSVGGGAALSEGCGFDAFWGAASTVTEAGLPAFAASSGSSSQFCELSR
eukprot:2211213-Pleurochrysis_carterae.AAC.1